MNFMRTSAIVLSGRFLAAVGLIVCLMNVNATPPPVRILPLGDSITYGYPVAGGYRLPLYQLLTNAGYTVDFTGTQTNNRAPGLPDPDHEGHPGWTIRQINAIATDVLASTDDPDVILLLIGVNDYGQNDDIANAHTRLQGLVENLATNRPYAKILVANLLATTSQAQDTEIQLTFNPYVPMIATNEQALGRQVYFDDLRSALTTNDLGADGGHPNQVGYNKMATNWFANLTNYISALGTTNLPGISHVRGVDGWTNVIVTFSKPVADSATNLSNYSLSGGVGILVAALDGNSRRVVTLATTRQLPQSNYILTVSGVQDITPAANMILTNSTAAFTSVPLRGVFNNVPEATNFTLVYSLDVPTSAVFGNPPYSVTNLNIGPFDRVAYYLELQHPSGPFQFVWVSMNPFTTNVTRIGVPTDNSGVGTNNSFQQPLTNMNIFSPVPGIVNGTGLSGGNMEFWPGNYDQINSALVPNASSTAFDWGDRITTSGFGYGSMQLHNNAASEVLLAFNNWGAGGNGGPVDLGIGNRANTADVDWTFANNALSYTIKTLQVLVRPLSDTSPPVVTSVTGLKDRRSISVAFNEPVADSATNLSDYALSGGLNVLAVSLDQVTRTLVTLTTSAQTPSNNYTLSIIGVRDRFGNTIAANTSVSFLSVPLMPPVILTQPASQARYIGGTAIFSINLGGASPFAYQWSKNGSEISGATSATLTLANVQFSNAANYSVSVTNSDGYTKSAAASLTLLSGGYGGVVCSDQPVAYYPLNETIGTVAHDYFSGYDGSYVGNPTLGVPGATPDTGTAVRFNGSSQYVDAGNPSGLNFTGPITLEAWVNSETTPADGLFHQIIAHSYDGVDETSLGVDGGYGYGAGSYNGTSYTANAPVPPADLTNWVYLVGTYDGAGWNLYRNGVLLASQAGPLGALIVNAGWVIGAEFNEGRHFQGSIDEVAIYNHALSPSRILTHYQTGLYFSHALSIGATNGALSISFQAGTLQQADSVTGPYADLTGVSSPYQPPKTGASKFYRLKF
jgi:lysophospholipase L1-like esterase